jgi:hypothetical protein
MVEKITRREILNRFGQAALATGFSSTAGKSLPLPVTDAVFNGHKVILDKKGKIIPWYDPVQDAYDHFYAYAGTSSRTAFPSAPAHPHDRPIRSITSTAYSRKIRPRTGG